MLEKEATFADDVVSRVWQEDVGDDLSGNVVCDTRGLTSCRVRREAGRSWMSTAMCHNVVCGLVHCEDIVCNLEGSCGSDT